MKTHYPDGKPIHPEDLLRAFAGRLAPYHGLGVSQIEALYCARQADVSIVEVTVDEGLATGLRDLGEDFETMRRAIDAWLKRSAPEVHE